MQFMQNVLSNTADRQNSTEHH